MNKRIVKCCMMCVGILILLFSIKVFAAECQLKLSANAPEKIKAGEEFVLTINISGASQASVCGGKIVLNYDKTKIEVLALEKGPALSNSMSSFNPCIPDKNGGLNGNPGVLPTPSESGKVIVSTAGLTTFSDGNMFSVKFRSKAESDGESSFIFDTESSCFKNTDSKDIAYSVQNAVTSITSDVTDSRSNGNNSSSSQISSETSQKTVSGNNQTIVENNSAKSDNSSTENDKKTESNTITNDTADNFTEKNNSTSKATECDTENLTKTPFSYVLLILSVVAAKVAVLLIVKIKRR